MNQTIGLGIIGEYDPDLRSHNATNQSIYHAAAALSITTDATWISTQSLSGASVGKMLNSFHGLFCAPGDYKNMNGVLSAIRFAREKGRPFIGT